MNKLGRLIKTNDTRFMFQSSNNLGDQIITITDYDNVVVTKKVRFEGDWFTDYQLESLLNESKDIQVITISKLTKGV